MAISDLVTEEIGRLRGRARTHAFPDGRFAPLGALNGARRLAVHLLVVPLAFHPPLVVRLVLTPVFVALGGDHVIRERGGGRRGSQPPPSAAQRAPHT